MNKQIRLLIIIPLLICFTNETYSQKSREKTIIYGDDYNVINTANGYVAKKKFVENQNLTFRTERDLYDGRILRDTIVSGKYFTKDGNAYIDGIWKEWDRDFKELVRVKGVFKVSNNTNGIGITTNKKKGKQLIVHILSNSPYYINIKRRNISLESNTPHLEEQRLYPYTFEKEILNDKNVKLSFGNGDVFTGTLQEDYQNDEYGYTPDNGEYKYSTGEVCTGTFYYSNYYRQIFLSKGKTVFTDGSIGKDNWLLQYDLSSNEREEIDNSRKSPTEKLNMAKNISAEKEQKLLVKKIEIEQKNQEIIQNNKTIQSNLIKKYGDYWGNIIYKKEYTPGMTKEMVLEFTNDKYYKISKLIRNGNSIEIWEFDKQKMMSEIIKSGDKKEANNLLVYSQYESMGLVDNLESGFPTLVFSYGKLTDVYQN